MASAGRRHSVEASHFAMVPRADVPRSAFSVVHTHKTTIGTVSLVPVLVMEVLPGDSHRVNMTAFARIAVPLVPVMDNLMLESFFFFVPNRLVWDHWERFMGEREEGTGTPTTYLVPQLPLATTDINEGSLADYMGITVNAIAGRTINVNALPFRAYRLIYNDWFRDQDIVAPYPLSIGDGPDDPAVMNVMFARAKQRDYFTSARPWPQKAIGVEDVLTVDGPIRPGGRMSGWGIQGAGGWGAGAPVTGIGVAAGSAPTAGAGAASMKMPGTRSASPDPYWTTADDPLLAMVGPGDVPDIRVLINDIRTANMVQLLLERNARGGTRYAEIVRSHFGVVSPDARLQRPEYLGGGRSFLQLSPIAQTSASGIAGTTTVLGEQAATGSFVATRHGFSQSFTEHGYIIGIISVRPDLTYQQGVARMWWRRSQFDFYWPSLAHLGEQAILQGEIYAQGNADDKGIVFGYQERWSEYKYMPSRTSGYARSVSATPLDMWHFGQEFTAAPTLNSNFISVDNTAIQRSLQTSTLESAHHIVDCMFDIRMVRPMPMFSIPGLSLRL